MKLSSSLLVGLVSASAFAQLGGGAATFGGRDRASIRDQELAKRTPAKEEGTYIEAAVLINLNADEYVAVFAISTEGETLAAARKASEDRVSKFKASLKSLAILDKDANVDFVSQNRIYGFNRFENNVAFEDLVGFEVKTNVSVRYKHKAMLDRMLEEGAAQEIYDLVKVDYIIHDQAAVRTRLMKEAAKVLKRKTEEMGSLLGHPLAKAKRAYAPVFSLYAPAEQYNSYLAQESQDSSYRAGVSVERTRKPRTFYFNGLTARDFDTVVNPAVAEPGLQATVFVRVRY